MCEPHARVSAHRRIHQARASQVRVQDGLDCLRAFDIFLGQAASNAATVMRERDEAFARNVALTTQVRELQAQVAALELNASTGNPAHSDELARLLEFEARIMAVTRGTGGSASHVPP